MAYVPSSDTAVPLTNQYPSPKSVLQDTVNFKRIIAMYISVACSVNIMNCYDWNSKSTTQKYCI